MSFRVKDTTQLHDMASGKFVVVVSFTAVSRCSESIQEGVNRCVLKVELLPK